MTQILRESTRHVIHEHSRSDRCQRGILRFDFYKQPFRLLLPDRKNEYRTFAGGLLSILTIVLMLYYATYKLNTLITKDDYKVQLRRRERYYEV